MNCPYCGQDNPETNETCDFCGGSLHEPVEPQKHEIQQPEVAPTDLPSTPNQAPSADVISPPLPAARKGIYGNKIWWFIGCFGLIFLIVACVAAGWGIYRFIFESGTINIGSIIQPTETSSTPVPVPTSESLIFFDDFSNPNSGWDQVEEADYSTNYYNNAYRITVNTDMYDSWANPNIQTYTDAIIEVDATKNGGPDDNDFGVICRYQDSKHFYYAVISSDGYYGIIKASGDSSGLLGREYLEYSDAIPQGYATNHLRLECLGDTLSFYANGQLLDQQTDGEYADGDVGLIAGTYDNPGTDILFDNFSVYTP
jgi:hypothetical protein